MNLSLFFHNCRNIGVHPLIYRSKLCEVAVLMQSTNFALLYMNMLALPAFSHLFSNSAGKEYENMPNKQIITEIPNRKTKGGRPNYFISLRIQNPQILDKVTLAQNLIVNGGKEGTSDVPPENGMTSFLVAVNCSHLTLMVMKLDEYNCMHKAHSAMQQVANKWKGGNIPFEIRGINNFDNEVVFAEVTKNEGFDKMAKLRQLVIEEFGAQGIHTSDDKSFTPHLTIAKKPFSRDKKHKKVPQEYYESMREELFGEEIVTELHLCPMSERKQDDGYYFTACKFTLAESDIVSTEHLDDDVIPNSESTSLRTPLSSFRFSIPKSTLDEICKKSSNSFQVEAKSKLSARRRNQKRKKTTSPNKASKAE